MAIFVENENGKVNINLIPISILAFVMMAVAKMIGIIQWSWLWIAIIAAAPIIFLTVFALVSVIFVCMLFVISWITKGCPKIKIDMKVKG